MITGLRPFGKLANRTILLVMLVAFVLVGYADLVLSVDRTIPLSPGVLWFVLLGYGMHIIGGLLNRSWRELPATTRERRAAAWLLVGVLPLLMAVVVTLADAAIAAVVGHHDLAGRSVALFALQALVVQAYAWVAVGYGNWPGTVDHYWQVSQRQARDWMMIGVMFAIMIAVARWGHLLTALGAGAWPAVVIAVMLCVLLLPVAQRIIRLDRPIAASGVMDTLAARVDWLPTIRWSGWRGHFGRTTVRTLVIWALAMIYGSVILGFGREHHAVNTASDAYMRGFAMGATFGSTAALWLTPAFAGTLITVMSQQYLLRARRMLLSLPRGELLVLVTPTYTLAISFAATLVVVSPWLGGARYLPLQLIGCGAAALAVVQLLLALNLVVVSYAGLLGNALVFMLLGGIVGGVAGVVDVFQLLARIEFWIALTLGALVLAAAATWLAHWQLATRRNPYRPWPGAGGGWRGA
jgi:hypothetical protein